jgi:hypothetical protein
MCLRRSGSGNRFVRDKSLQVKTGIDKLRRVWRAPALKAGLAKHIGCRIADGLHRDKVLANKTPYRKPSRAAAGTLHMTKVRVIDRQHPGGLQFHIILVGPEPRCLATRRVIAGDGGGRPLGLFPRIVNRFNAHAMAIVGIKRAVTNGIDVGRLVRMVLSVTMPFWTVRPACVASPVFGATPMPTTSMSASTWRPSASVAPTKLSS